MNTYNILDLIGNTPLVKVQNILQKENVTLLLKLEGNNPGGSVKDRAALNMIQSALDRNEINQNSKLIEPTSGNTGIALAMIAQLFGLDIELVMSASATKERVQTMKAYGAKVTLTPADKGIIGARDYAEAKVKTEGFYMFNQFGNDDNWNAHYKTTGPEIWRDTEGELVQRAVVRQVEFAERHEDHPGPKSKRARYQKIDRGELQFDIFAAVFELHFRGKADEVAHLAGEEQVEALGQKGELFLDAIHSGVPGLQIDVAADRGAACQLCQVWLVVYVSPHHGPVDFGGILFFNGFVNDLIECRVNPGCIHLSHDFRPFYSAIFLKLSFNELATF